MTVSFQEAAGWAGITTLGRVSRSISPLNSIASGSSVLFTFMPTTCSPVVCRSVCLECHVLRLFLALKFKVRTGCGLLIAVGDVLWP